ncbi:uncharacterized protein At2g27730, mitochondrial isoform X2 [Malania oleifera]|nr:uncharacterized protein At2g27730, mitochondrial isoform X2 [Malania oleifera]
MATRSVVCRASLSRFMDGTRGSSRYFSDSKGRVLSEEERAAENVYIQKKEREKMEKMKRQLEKEKAAAEKGKAEN